MLAPAPEPALAVTRGRELRPGCVVASVPERWAVQGPRRFAGPVGEPPRYGRGGVADATLASHGSISSLGLSRCGLNDRTARALASGLAGIAAMKTIDLSRNDDMTDAVVVYLNKLLSLNKSITELNAHGCGFGGRSMGAIKDKLRYNNSFVKAFFSEATSRVIFRVVDVIQKAEEDVLLTSLKEFKRCR